MAAHPVTLRLPETLYDLFQSRAERAHRSLEAELLDAVATVAEDQEDLSHDLAKAIEDLELLTDREQWNCQHLANANKYGHIRRVNNLLGLYVPVLATPMELLGENDEREP